MTFEKKVPEWVAAGTEPPSELKERGFQAGYKPPADYFNWFWKGTSECLTELQEKAASTDLSNVTDEDFLQKMQLVGEDSEVTFAPEKISMYDAFQFETEITPGKVKVAVSSESGMEEATLSRRELSFFRTYEDDETGDEITEAIGVVRGLKKTEDETAAVPYGQMVRYVEENSNSTPIVAAHSDDGKAYYATVEGVDAPYVGMELTIIPDMTSVITGPSLILNGGEKIGMRVTASTTNSSFNGTRPDFMNAGAPVKLMFMERTTQDNAAYAVMSNGQIVTMLEPGTWANGYILEVYDNTDDGAMRFRILTGEDGDQADECYIGEPYDGMADISAVTSWSAGIYQFSNGTDASTTHLWRIMNSVRVNAEALMSNNAEGGGMYPCTPGKSNEKLVWNTPAKVGADINKNSVFAATSSDGNTYTVDAPAVTSYYKGLEITIIPNMDSTSKTATVNVNGLGAKQIFLNASGRTGGYFTPKVNNFLTAGIAVTLLYAGSAWRITNTIPSAEHIDGQVAVKNGGTGKSTLTKGSYLVGNGTNALALKTPAQVLADIGALPLTGGELTSELKVTDTFCVKRTMEDVLYTSYLKPMNYALNGEYTTGIVHYVDGVNDAQLVFNKNGVMLRDNVTPKVYNIYGQHNVETMAAQARVYLYTYGTNDMTAGTSELGTGKLYFVYEE